MRVKEIDVDDAARAAEVINAELGRLLERLRRCRDDLAATEERLDRERANRKDEQAALLKER